MGIVVDDSFVLMAVGKVSTTRKKILRGGSGGSGGMKIARRR